MFEVSVLGIPLTFVVFGLVAFLGGMGVKGKAQLASSLGLGSVIGFFYQFSMNGAPVDASQWFGYLIYGLGLGVLATGLYEGQKQAAGR